MIGIRQLAAHLDLSIGTVSRALNDRGDVSPQTRERVLNAAAELGYSPNQAGRSLRRGRTDLVAMVVPADRNDSLINPFFLSLLDGLKRRLDERGLDLAVFLEGGGEDDRLGALKRLSERSIADVLIIADIESVDPRVDYLLSCGRPFVAFGRTAAPGRYAWVDPDFDAAVESAIDHLVRLGHRWIGLVAPDRPLNKFAIIEAGYRRVMAARGFPVAPNWQLRRAAGERGGREAADALLAAAPPLSAVLVVDGLHAVALYRRLGERGLRPGADLSIVALLPEARAHYLIPRLTTLQTDWTAIGERLADAVEAELAIAFGGAKTDGRTRPRVQALVQVALSPGESVGPVAAEPAAAAAP